MSEFKIHGQKQPQVAGKVPREVMEALQAQMQAEKQVSAQPEKEEKQDQQKLSREEVEQIAKEEFGTVPTKDPVIDEIDNIEITDNDLDNYFAAIVDDTPYTEVLNLLNGRLKVRYRSRTVEETSEIIKKISKDNPETNADLEATLGKYYLLFSLVSIESKKGMATFDTGTFEQRLKRIDELHAPKYMVLMQGMYNFDTKLEKLRLEASKPNF